MDIGPGSDQLELRDSVRDVLAAECPPDLARRTLAAAPGSDNPQTHFGAIDLVVVLEECGAAIAPIPLLSSVGLVAGVLRSAGVALDTWIAEIADGAIATLAVQVPGQRLPAAPMKVAGGRMRGRAVAVPDLVNADMVVTLATGDDGLVAAVVRAGKGVHIDAADSVDPSRPLAELEVDTVPAATAPVNIDAALAVPLLAAAAELVGIGAAALRRSVEHAKTRVQFGKPIGSFQGVKHPLADNYVCVERARSLIYAAAACIDDPVSTAAQTWTAAALAKAAAGDAALAATRTGVQVHGALAQTWEHDMHLYLRRAWQGAALLGDSRALYHAVGARFVRGSAQ